MKELIVVLASRLELGQRYVSATWKTYRIDGQDRASVFPRHPPLTVAVGEAVPIKETLIPLRIITREEQLHGLEVTEIHTADSGVSWTMIELAETRKR